MSLQSFTPRLLSTAVLTALLLGCGGGDGGSVTLPLPVAPAPAPNQPTPEDENLDVVVTAPVTEVSDDPLIDTTPPITTPENDDTVLTPSELNVLNRLNLRRGECGFGALATNVDLQNAADNHAKYISYMTANSTAPLQGHQEYDAGAYSGLNNPYFTGNSIGERINTTTSIGTAALPVSYDYRTLTENLSVFRYNEPYLTANGDAQIALSSINGLLAAPYHMASLLSPGYNEAGISYQRDLITSGASVGTGSTPNYVSVLEIVMGSPKGSARTETDTVINYPCDGVMGTQHTLRNETPNPFGNTRDLNVNPIGQPIYILGTQPITVTDYRMTDAANQDITLQALTQANDPNAVLGDNQVVLMPLTSLQPSQSYRVTYTVTTADGVTQTKAFSFTTRA